MNSFREYLRKDKIQDFPINLTNEGLILSWEYNILEKKLNELFSSYKIIDKNIVIYEEAIKINIFRRDISNNFFRDFETLLHLSGYNISNYITDNDKNWKKGNPEKDILFSRYNELQLMLNKKFDTKEKGIPEKLYHVSENKYINKIKIQGLKPTSKNKIEKHPDRIYVFGSMKNAEFYKSDLEERFNQQSYLILEIDTTLINNIILYKDPKFPGYRAYYTYSNISPFAIINL